MHSAMKRTAGLGTLLPARSIQDSVALREAALVLAEAAAPSTWVAALIA